ncbi:hypothetical protein [Marinifilum caeruleilacunae]|uniref:DUF4878 domain-containing protein n=1 Tax=Marinifilum caeruleilacunae TaxID=2499076 RepID=A0ABX1X1K6_9BACT|nr:hypothetical protein [Marinifilum caeruleilacunae]NOU62242.1 hypothetical protein [Marinifilum caeruleilacunae]
MIRYLTLILFIGLLAGCKFNKNQTYRNDNIPASIVKKINQLDLKVIEAIQQDDTKSLESVLSDKLLENVGQNKIDSIFKIVSRTLKEKDFKKKDQFYVENANKDVSNSIFSGLKSEDDYIVQYKAMNKKMFISILLPKSTEDEQLITLIYGLYGNEWKLNIFQFGQYSILNKTAIDYYKIADAYFKSGELVDAASNLAIGQQCLRPGNQHIQYRKEKDFIDLQKKVMEEINKTYVFPLSVEQVETKPQIFNIHPQRVDEGNFPMVRYYSKIDLKDTLRLKQENLEMQKCIGKLFKGIDKNNKYIFYRAFDELPDGTYKYRKHYGFIQKLNEN